MSDRAMKEIEDDIYRQEHFARMIAARVKNASYPDISPGQKGWIIGGVDSRHIYVPKEYPDGSFRMMKSDSWVLPQDVKGLDQLYTKFIDQLNES